MVDFASVIEQAATEGPNMNEAQGGGDFERELPAAGLARLRLISYIEIGVHKDGKPGQEKNKELVKLQFELSGPKHQPKKLDDGRLIPHVVTITLPLSLNEKANFYKLFKRMNHTGEYRHMAQMLGHDFLGTVVHRDNGKEGADKRTYANLRDDGGYTIRPPFVEDPETGESKRVTADPQITATKCFLWNYATKEMWDALFIDGKYDDVVKDGKVVREGGSKNYWQNQIKGAINFADSPIGNLLFAGEADLPGAEKPERSDDAKQAATEADANANNNDDPLAAVA